MGCYTRNLSLALCGATLLAGHTMVQAAALNLIPGYPDVSGSVDLDYNYTATKGQKDGFGEMTITNELSYLFYNHDGSGFEAFSGTYLLTANFGELGDFVGGTLTITNTSALATLPGGAAPGTLLSGNLFNFGFSGTGGSDFTLEFEADSLSGPMAAFGSLSGTIAGGWSNLTGTSVLDAWDSDEDFTHDFSAIGSGGSVNTWVPVPAAVWLFGSGLVGLLAAARQRHWSK